MYLNTPLVRDQGSQNPSSMRCTLKSSDEKERPLEFPTSYLTVTLQVRRELVFTESLQAPPTVLWGRKQFVNTSQVSGPGPGIFLYMI